MDKNTVKKQNSYDQTAIIALVEKYKMSKQYIRQCLRGDRKSLSADKIRRDYKLLLQAINELIKTQTL